jgi:hypothetical protein
MSDNRVFHEKRAIGKGDWGPARGDYSGATVVSGSGSSRFGEAALKGHLFTGLADTLTLLTNSGNTVGHTAAQAVTATGTALFNPTGSGVALVLLRVSMSINSGTLAAGGVYHGVGTGQTVLSSIDGAAAGTSCLVGSGAVSAGRVFEKATSTTYTGASACTAISPIVGFTAAAITTGLIQPIVDEVDGAIVLLPGSEYRPLFTAVGTSVIYNIGYTWAEVPTTAV